MASPSPAPSTGIPSNTPPSFYPDMRAFAGPTFLGALCQGIETGVVLTQCLRFCARARNREGTFVKACVAYVTVLSVVQTGIGFYGAWLQLVVHFGDYSVAAIPNWTSKILPVMNAMLAAPVQGFLIWRCWLLTKRSKLLLTAFLLFYAASITFAIATVQRVFAFDFKAVYEAVGVALETGQPLPQTGMDPVFLCCLTFPAVMDTALTTILFVFLFRSRTDVVTRRFRKTLTSLMIVIWEAALPPTACAIAALVTYVVSYKKTFWDLFFVCVLGQLYVVALFVTVNGFHDVKKRDSEAALRRAVSVPDVSFSTSAFSSGGSRTRSGSGTAGTNEEAGDILSTWARDASASFAVPLSIVLEEEAEEGEGESGSGDRTKVEEEEMEMEVPMPHGRHSGSGAVQVETTVRVSFEHSAPPLRSSPLHRTSFNIVRVSTPIPSSRFVEEEREEGEDIEKGREDVVELEDGDDDELEKVRVEEDHVDEPVSTLPRLSFSSTGSESRRSRSRWAVLRLGGRGRTKMSAVG